MKSFTFLIVLFFLLTHKISSQESYFFREGTDATFYDQGIVDLANLGGSTFEHTAPPCCPAFNDKVPCSTTAYQGTTSLKFNYTSASGGNWLVSIFRNDWADVDISGHNKLTFYIYSEAALPKEALPKIAIRAKRTDNGNEENSVSYSLEAYNNDVVAQTWTEISFPLDALVSDPANSHLNFNTSKAVVFEQIETDGSSRLLYIDDIKTWFEDLTPDPVTGLKAKGYDSHIELSWNSVLEDAIYRVYASFDGGTTYQLRKEISDTIYLDFVRGIGFTGDVLYRVVHASGSHESLAAEISGNIRDFTDEELLDMVQEYTWRYFWDFGHKSYGMTYERSNDSRPDVVASGASGMGLMAMIVGYERELAPREEIKDRILKMLDFLDRCDKYHGAYSHWYNGATLKTVPFFTEDDGGDIVETSFVAQGLLAIKNYFTGTDTKEQQIREIADKLWREIEWSWYRQNNDQVLTWHWSPNYEWHINHKFTGFNETQITYFLAVASPTHPVPVSVYDEGWARNGTNINEREYYGFKIKVAPDYGGPLFWAHYSHLGLNPNGLKDRFIDDYGVEAKNIAKIHHAYAVNNPLSFTNYSGKCWGLTASDDPEVGYKEHRPTTGDNGTITPTAALGSFPYTPAESLAALKYFYQERGAELFGRYGFYDAFNDHLSKVIESYIGIDQGPILIMIENYRTGLLWNTFMKDSDVANGLEKISSVTSGFNEKGKEGLNDYLKIYPVPCRGNLHVVLPEYLGKKKVDYKITTLDGKSVKADRLFSEQKNNIDIDINDLKPGYYILSLSEGERVYSQKIIIE